jgi:hypothetical protein
MFGQKRSQSICFWRSGVKVRAVSILYGIAALSIFPTPAWSAIERVVGGGSVHQGETRRLTAIGDGIDFATSVNDWISFPCSV